jgi:hypothetical protein
MLRIGLSSDSANVGVILVSLSPQYLRLAGIIRIGVRLSIGAGHPAWRPSLPRAENASLDPQRLHCRCHRVREENRIDPLDDFARHIQEVPLVLQRY